MKPENVCGCGGMGRPASGGSLADALYRAWADRPVARSKQEAEATLGQGLPRLIGIVERLNAEARPSAGLYQGGDD